MTGTDTGVVFLFLRALPGHSGQTSSNEQTSTGDRPKLWPLALCNCTSAYWRRPGIAAPYGQTHHSSASWSDSEEEQVSVKLGHANCGAKKDDDGVTYSGQENEKVAKLRVSYVAAGVSE